mgnify:CR=1 FL=1
MEAEAAPPGRTEGTDEFIDRIHKALEMGDDVARGLGVTTTRTRVWSIAVAVVLAIGIVGQISGDGESNWLEGAQLLALYVMLGISFYFVG